MSISSNTLPSRRSFRAILGYSGSGARRGVVFHATREESPSKEVREESREFREASKVFAERASLSWIFLFPKDRSPLPLPEQGYPKPCSFGALGASSADFGNSGEFRFFSGWAFGKSPVSKNSFAQEDFGKSPREHRMEGEVPFERPRKRMWRLREKSFFPFREKPEPLCGRPPLPEKPGGFGAKEEREGSSKRGSEARGKAENNLQGAWNYSSSSTRSSTFSAPAARRREKIRSTSP